MWLVYGLAIFFLIVFGILAVLGAIIFMIMSILGIDLEETDKDSKGSKK